MNAPAVALDRARIDALVLDLVACLRAADLHVIAAAIDAPVADLDRVSVIRDQSDRIRLEGRLTFLCTATLWAANAIEAHSSGLLDEAMRWAEKTGFDVERYSDFPKGDFS